ncbi:unnamed protein product [Caenorhabditis bovis]|uniref:GP-PDE domain-containing protein n=1 Tax=Caenorhabditis bovis TaxID=2654633 RepID=A0A8S1EV11_9PELO|nr:unnamed protein product [Caenorhabditis bovis]
MHFTRRAISPLASFVVDERVGTVNSSLSRRPLVHIDDIAMRQNSSYSSLAEDDVESQVMSMARLVRVFFAVDIENLQPHHTVFVVGNVESLGKWVATQAMPLQQDEHKKIRWRGSIETKENQLKFRYFVGYYLNADGVDKLIVDKWEAFLNPRSTLCQVENRDGVCRIDRVDLFGYYAGRKCVSDGWLQHAEENQILLRLHGNALKFYKTAKERKNCRVKLTPLDVRYKQSSGAHISFSYGEDEDDDDDETTNSPPPCTHSQTHVAVLSDPKPKFYEQDETGVVFNNNKDYIVFRTHSIANDYLAFYIEIFSEERKRIGACYALPNSMQDTCGLTQLPFINTSGRPIGQITIEYLFVKPLCLGRPQLMDLTYCRHWKKRNALEVGHRGAGNSYTKFAMSRENTIHSLNTAAKNGADYVEFDVQLTKDKIAVIYHDFHVLVSVARRDGNATPVPDPKDVGNMDFHELPVKDLKLSQLKLLMLDHLSFPQRKENVKKLVEQGEMEEDFKPFPTLVEALTKVDPDVGFNVEVKYPMMQNNGLHECDHYFERNQFVDIILADVLNHAGSRRIMFSSFDPDICSMVATKQNKYPVLFLCVGDTQRYTPFQDQRTSTSMTAVNFAVGADLLGVNFNSEDLLKDPMPIKKANEFGMVTFVWGEDLDKKENINYFKKELGVDGVIYDRIGEEERRRNVFIVEREQKRVLLSCSGASTPQRAPSPVLLDNNNSSSQPVPLAAHAQRIIHSDPVLIEEDEDEHAGGGGGDDDEKKLAIETEKLTLKGAQSSFDVSHSTPMVK